MTGSTDPDDLGGADLGRLLTDLADDPDAPPTSVSALSVIAAARSGARPAEPAPTAAEPMVPAGAESAGSTAAGSAPPTVGELHVLTARQDADRRAKRRRTFLIGGLAAACAVAVAAIVIPLAVSKSASTTSAGASPDTSQAGAPAQASQAGGAAAAAPSAESSAQAGLAATDQSQAGGTAAPTVNPLNPDENRPPPGESALTQTVPVPGGTAPTNAHTAAAGGVAPGGAPATSCWPALSDAASAALVAALPQGAFGPPGPLGLGCPADPVAGASLTGTAAPDAQLVVRVTHAEPGACAQSASETGAKCVARGGDQYVSNDSGNLSVYAYGNGYEVQVGGRPATGIAPIPSGLPADQLSTAAAAVLASLG